MADQRPSKANTLRVKISRFIDAEASAPWGILGVVLIIALMAAPAMRRSRVVCSGCLMTPAIHFGPPCAIRRRWDRARERTLDRHYTASSRASGLKTLYEAGRGPTARRLPSMRGRQEPN